jgi:hypothetical protein
MIKLCRSENPSDLGRYVSYYVAPGCPSNSLWLLPTAYGDAK